MKEFIYGATLLVLAAIGLYVTWRLLRWIGRTVWIIIQGIREDRALARQRDTHDLEQRIDQWARAYLARRPNARVTVGVAQRARSFVRGYGKAFHNGADGQAVYEIGSVTKVFTTIALAKLVQEGLVGFDDPITRLLPDDVQLPPILGRITLRQLANHTSGLPRLPPFIDKVPDSDPDPYAKYSVEAMYADLRAGKLARPSGGSPDYSNYGMGLLGLLLARRAGTSFAGLIDQAICTPLGMADTVVTLSAEQAARLIPGHTPTGQPTAPWAFDALVGAGALRSTANDMLRFLEANLNPADDDLGKAVARAQEVEVRSWTGCHQGLGWQVDQDDFLKRTAHWHNGGTGGYVSYVSFDKERQLGVVVLSNHGDAMAGDDSIDQLGLRVLKMATKVSLGSQVASDAGRIGP